MKTRVKSYKRKTKKGKVVCVRSHTRNQNNNLKNMKKPRKVYFLKSNKYYGFKKREFTNKKEYNKARMERARYLANLED